LFDHLFICEKASLSESVAEARAAQTGQKARKEGGTWRVGDDAFFSLSGHIYEQARPEDYDPGLKEWSIATLPIFPSKWKLVPGKDRQGKPHIAKIKEINTLMKDARTLVGVGDPGREGQLLVDEVIVEAGMDPFAPNVLRMWFSDMSMAKRIEALEGLFPNIEKRTLYLSALARQRADWCHGMSLTRAYTVLARQGGGNFNGPLSVGRVQTPTLKLVVDRDREIAKFVAVDHYLPTGTFRHANGTFAATLILTPDHEGLDSEGRLVDKAVAARIAEKVMGKTGPVESYVVTKKKKPQPLLYTLTDLEKACNAKFGFPNKKTDDIAQALYETHKVASYPRTDCRHGPTGILNDESARMLSNLGGHKSYADLVGSADGSMRSHVWNDAKVAASDAGHYGLLPTLDATPGKIAALSPDEFKVFDLIAKTFLSQFFPEHTWDSTSAVVAVAGERFKASGRKVTQVGWKAVYGQGLEKDDDEDEDEQSLPVMAKGDPVKAEQAVVTSKRTTPPSHFTEGSLVDAMQNIHKFVPDGELKKRLKENAGIGTTATRTATIEILKHRAFLVPKGKYIVSTPLAGSLVDVIDDRHKDPGMTALWEGQFDKINKGELEVDRFLDVLRQDLTKTIERLASTGIRVAGSEPLEGDGGPCPSCGKGKLRTRTLQSGEHKNKRILSCDAYSKDDPQSCRFAQWPDKGGKPVPKLEGDGDTCPECSKGTLTTKMLTKGDHKGKRYLSCTNWKGKDDPASCRYTAWEKPKVTPLPGDGYPCPSCGKGHLVTVQVNQGEHKGLRFLVCDARKRDDPSSCQYRQFQKAEPLPGDGDPCPSCGSGKKRTVAIQKGENKGKRFLVCSDGKRDDPSSCQWREFPRDKVEPLDGEGVLCEKCAAGRMRTRMVQGGENKGKRFLSCDGYDKDDPRSCRNSVWPDEGAAKKTGKGAKPAAGKAPAGGKGKAGARKGA
jgi:DNA topoisomerase-3